MQKIFVIGSRGNNLLPWDTKISREFGKFCKKSSKIQISVGCQRIHRRKCGRVRGVVVIIIVIIIIVIAIALSSSFSSSLSSSSPSSSLLVFKILNGNNCKCINAEFCQIVPFSGESNPPSAAPTPENPAPRFQTQKRIYFYLLCSYIFFSTT